MIANTWPISQQNTTILRLSNYLLIHLFMHSYTEIYTLISVIYICNVKNNCCLSNYWHYCFQMPATQSEILKLMSCDITRLQSSQPNYSAPISPQTTKLPWWKNRCQAQGKEADMVIDVWFLSGDLSTV